MRGSFVLFYGVCLIIGTIWLIRMHQVKGKLDDINLTIDKIATGNSILQQCGNDYATPKVDYIKTASEKVNHKVMTMHRLVLAMMIQYIIIIVLVLVMICL